MKNEIVELFHEFTEDIEDVFGKPWLKTAIVSAISGHVAEDKSVVREVVDKLYAGHSREREGEMR